MKWFGETWQSHVNMTVERVPTPTGQTCIYCGQPILEAHSGLLVPYGAADESLVTEVAFHRLCFGESLGIDSPPKTPDPERIADRLEGALDDTSALEFLILECEALQVHDRAVRARLHEALFAAARWLIDHESPEQFVWSAIRTGACWGRSRDLGKLVEFLQPGQSQKVRQVSLQAISNVSPHGPQPLLPELGPLRVLVGDIIRVSCTPAAAETPSQAALAISAIAAGEALGLPAELVGHRAFEGHPLLLRQLENKLRDLRERWGAPGGLARCPDCELLGPEEAPVCRHGERLYPRCPECGGQVLLCAKPGRTREVLRGIHVAVPDDFRLPMCVDCGEESMTAEISNVLDPILLRKISDAAADESIRQLEGATTRFTRDLTPGSDPLADLLRVKAELEQAVSDLTAETMIAEDRRLLDAVGQFSKTLLHWLGHVNNFELASKDTRSLRTLVALELSRRIQNADLDLPLYKSEAELLETPFDKLFEELEEAIEAGAKAKTMTEQERRKRYETFIRAKGWLKEGEQLSERQWTLPRRQPEMSAHLRNEQQGARVKLIREARTAARCWADDDGIGAYYLDALVKAVRGYEAVFPVDDPLRPESGSAAEDDDIVSRD